MVDRYGESGAAVEIAFEAEAGRKGGVSMPVDRETNLAISLWLVASDIVRLTKGLANGGRDKANDGGCAWKSHVAMAIGSLDDLSIQQTRY